MHLPSHEQTSATLARLRCLRARDRGLARRQEVGAALGNCRDLREAAAELVAILGVDELGALSIRGRPC